MKTSMMGFLWGIIKCLPAPLLMALSVVAGMAALWLLAQAGVWISSAVIFVILFIFIFAILNSAKGN